MPRRNTKPAVEQAPVEDTDPFAHIRLDMLASVGGLCDSCGNFADKNLKIAPLARQINVPPVTLSDYLYGKKNVGRVTLTRFINYLNAQKGVQNDEQAAAVAEVEALA
jgi:hypothetical protein